MKYFNNNALFLFSLCLGFTAVVYSPFLLSLAMIGILLSAIFEFQLGTSQACFRLNNSGFVRILKIHKHPNFAVFSLFFFIVFLSFWQNEGSEYWLSRTRIKLPFLLLPLAFLAQPALKKEHCYFVLYFLVALASLSSIGVLGYYIEHYREVNFIMERGQPMPTVRNHIRFSYVLVLAICAGFYLWRKKHFFYKAWESKFMLANSVFLFLFLHLLSARSGLLAIYFILGLAMLSYLFQNRSFRNLGIALALFISFLTLPLLAYKFVPSFQSKIDYMRWDLKMHQEGKGMAYSDSPRIVSFLAAKDLFLQKPVFGVGSGNLKKEMKRVFEADYPGHQLHLRPHNQFLWVAAANGIIGLALFIFAFLFPFFYKKGIKEPLVLASFGLFLVAFMVDHPLESSMGVGLFCLFNLFLMLQQRDDFEHKKSL